MRYIPKAAHRNILPILKCANLFLSFDLTLASKQAMSLLSLLCYFCIFVATRLKRYLLSLLVCMHIIKVSQNVREITI